MCLPDATAAGGAGGSGAAVLRSKGDRVQNAWFDRPSPHTTQAALSNDALRAVARRERERMREVKRKRKEDLKKLKAAEDADFAKDQVRRDWKKGG